MMIDKKPFLLLIIFCYAIVHAVIAQENADLFKKIKAIPYAYQPFRFGEVTPNGWIKKQIEENLAGFTGYLDSLVPGLMIQDDIYGKDRLSKKVKFKNVGAVAEKGDWQVQFLWWNSESQSNWRDGFIRSALLVRDTKNIETIKTYVQKILNTQDKDGYIGIYDNELRYHFDNENGELWAKTTLFRGLLAWYEYTEDTHVLNAVALAVKNVMVNYPINGSHPFYSKNQYVSGLSHGLAFTDVLETLHRITAQQIYLDYALFLYKDFSNQILAEDAQYKKLSDTSLVLKGHGVHTYEHLRSVAAAYYISGNPLLKTALDNFLYKITHATLPSGGPVGDEWIGSNNINATSRGYEYCSVHELMNSYESLFEKSGDVNYGDKIERLFFNAAQGARDPDKSCIAYLKTDNSYVMTGGLNGDTTNKTQTRYKYSPVHQDAAVCCVPNAGRIAPYYVQSMWMKDDKSIVASLLGPCDLKTVYMHHPLQIKETTTYPFGNIISFQVIATNAKFVLKIRKPLWAVHYKIAGANYTEDNGFIVVKENWKNGKTITLEFLPDVEKHYDNRNDIYFTYGALVLAHPVTSLEKKSKSYPLPAFYDWKYTPENLVKYQYADNDIKTSTGDLIFETYFLNPETNKKEVVNLVPMGQTILRQVTFSVEK